MDFALPENTEKIQGCYLSFSGRQFMDVSI